MTKPFKTKRQASLNGLPFLHASGSENGGRNIATHVFASGYAHLNEDISPKPTEFSVSGYLMGNDGAEAMGKAKLLKAACDAGGVMRLVLPDDPLNMVRCTSVSISSSKEVANKVDISFKFVSEVRFGAATVFTMFGRLLEIGLGKSSATVGRMLGGGLNG